MSLTEAAAKFATNKSDEDKRIEAARAALFGVDSVVSLQDFEVWPHRTITDGTAVREGLSACPCLGVLLDRRRH